MKLVSFDIFDTVLIRKCGKPENIFFLLAYRLYPEDRAKREDFLLWRRNAEQRAKNRRRGYELTLDDIYQDDDLTGFTEYTASVILQCEKTIEAENLIVNPNIRKIIEEKRQMGYAICFISDMYLDSDFLASVLRREECLEDKDWVFVSCECNARKSNGKLFDWVKKTLRPKDWTHYGDNKHSDVKMARCKGIGTVHVHTDFAATERRIVDKSTKSSESYELSLLAGMERAARISLGDTPFVHIAADFVAPAYIPYVNFIFQEACKHGVKRLYFLSRDSYILLKAAQVLQSSFPDIELKYLFVSRKALLLPYLTETTGEAFLSIMDHHTIKGRKVNSLLMLLELDRKELSDKYGISFDYEKVANREQEEDFLNKIFSSKLTLHLKEKVKRQNALLFEYFVQEGLTDGATKALVDVGWLGTSRIMINSILRKAGCKEIDFYYYGIRNDVFPVKYGRYVSYFRAGQLTTDITAIVENYFSASPYPTTMGYEKRNDKVLPCFPKGQYVCESEIVKANTVVMEKMLQWGVEMKVPFDKAFFEWATTSLDVILNLKDPIVLSPFAQTGNLDTFSFVRKLSVMELVHLVLLGKNITAFDKASLQLTCGRPMLATLWRLKVLSGKVRRRLYLRYTK